MMTNENATVDTAASPAQPVVRTIGPGDVRDAIVKGIADFEAMPTHVVFLCLIYPIAMLVVARIYAGYDVLPLVFPLLTGYTLIGPLVAIGMYELSRRRERGLDTSRKHAFDVIRFASIGAIARLSVLLMAIYFAWIGTAWALYRLNFGDAVPESILAFTLQIVTTPAGWALVFVGCGAGFIFATATFALSVVSFPMLVDRDIDVVTAVRTSVRAVAANPITMGIWAFIVASGLVIGSLPFFVGLAVVLPVLGHATWHLYRKVVEPSDLSVGQGGTGVTG